MRDGSASWGTGSSPSAGMSSSRAPGSGPSSSSSPSSSVSSPGFLNTSSFPLTSLRFFKGTSGVPGCPSPAPALSEDLVFARSFFLCRFARFFAVFASARSSASLRRCSNSAVSFSYWTTLSVVGKDNVEIPTWVDSSSMIFSLSYSRLRLALYTWNSPLPAPALEP